MLAQLKEKEQILREQFENKVKSGSESLALYALVFLNENIGRTWLQTGLVKGERFARQQATIELKTFAVNANYLPCSSAPSEAY